MEMPSKRRNSASQTFEPLDEVDCRIIAALQQDPRLRIAELSRAVNLSAPAVADRVRRLEEREVISYRVDVNPRALGYPICAIVRVNPQSRKLHIIPQIAKEIPEVTECYRITGEDCYFLRLYLRSMDDLESILDRFAPYGRTTTSIVHSAPVPPRGLPL